MFMSFVYFYYLIALAKISSLIADKSGENDIIVFEFRGKVFSISLSNMLLAIRFF